VIEIHVEGSPIPKIKLFKDNDKPIIPNYRTDIFFDGTNVYRLLLNDPVPSDSGVYSCIADNQHGQYMLTHLVTFTGKRNCTLWPGMLHAHKKVLTEEDKEALRIANMERQRRRSDAEKFQLNDRIKSKLQFTARLSNRTAIEGETVVLFCSVQGLEPISFEWLKDDQPLNWGQSVSNQTKNKIGKISIINASKADSGVYECKVKNKRGSITTTAYLKVVETPKNDYVMPRFTKAIEEKYNYFRDELIMIIWVRGLPLPRLSWYKDGVELTNDDKYEFDCEADGSSRLRIRNPKTSDSGVYMCEAVNLAGYSKLFHTLTYRGDVNKPGEFLLW
jgi:Immunoglobulin I-set domain